MPLLVQVLFETFRLLLLFLLKLDMDVLPYPLCKDCHICGEQLRYTIIVVTTISLCVFYCSLYIVKCLLGIHTTWVQITA